MPLAGEAAGVRSSASLASCRAEIGSRFMSTPPMVMVSSGSRAQMLTRLPLTYTPSLEAASDTVQLPSS